MTAASILQAAHTFFGQAFPGQAGLVALAAFSLWIRKLCSGSSRFPITLPPQWLAVISAGSGLVYGVAESLYQGQTVGQTVVAGLCAAAAGGFFDLFATAVYDHKSLPQWVQGLLLLVDAGGGASGGGTLPTPPADARRMGREQIGPDDMRWPRGPFSHRNGHVLAMALVVASLIAGPVAFLAAGASQQSCIPAAAVPAIAKAADCAAVEIEDAGVTDPVAIASACALDDAVAAGTLLVSLLADRKWTAAHPLAAMRLRAALDAGADDAADVVTCVGSAPCFEGDPGYIPSPGVYEFPPRRDAAADWPPSTPQ